MGEIDELFKMFNGFDEDDENPLESEIDAISDLCVLISESAGNATQKRLYENCLSVQEDEIAEKIVSMRGVDKAFIEELAMEIRVKSMIMMTVIGYDHPDGLMLYESVARALDKAIARLEQKDGG